ncbi:MAG: RNA degradosome polyphosphate kinase [Phocaeicola sp.]
MDKKNSKTKGKERKKLSRDVSWMYFNHRILQEAQKKEVPLLERFSFLGIYSNNLDEFFRVRVATLLRLSECEDKTVALERESAKQELKQINKLNTIYSKEYAQAVQQVIDELAENQIYLVNEQQLNEQQQAYVKEYYDKSLIGQITPVWLSELRDLWYFTDEEIYLAVKLRKEKRRTSQYAVVQLPISTVGRFIELPQEEGKSYVMYLDDIVRCCLPQIFPGMCCDTLEAYSFKFTKDAEMEIENVAYRTILQKITKGVKSRKNGLPLRLVYDAQMPKELLKKISGKLQIEKCDTLLASGRYQNHKDLIKFPAVGKSDLRYPPWPAILKKELNGTESLLQLIRQKDRFLHVPYHSFDSFIRLLQEAAIHKEVKSIKMTLYRLARDSKVVKALINAARNGKKVTVVIELLARFDESSNIDWAKVMQDAGIHVLYGVEGLKVHSKLLHIGVRTGPDLACVSTGNFHEGNARIYTDCLLMSANRRIVTEVAAVFDFIERPYTHKAFKELLVSPNCMKDKFIRLIQNEIKNHKAGKPSGIWVKVNHITHPDLMKVLYDAAEAGVPIGLSVRGNCSLVTTPKKIGSHMKVNGIIDRYLEHARIFIFSNGGNPNVFMGSADWMKRNLENRIEVIVPIYDEEIKAELSKIVSYALKDNVKARVVDGTGQNKPWMSETTEPFHSQAVLYNEYLLENRNEELKPVGGINSLKNVRK